MNCPRSGFTAVEVLVTLFIATLFLSGAHQIYGMVLANGAESREISLASNYAYQALRRYADQTTNNCTTVSNIDMSSTLPSQPAITITSFKVDVDCPYGTATTLKRITASLTFDIANESKKVSHAILTR